MAARNTSTLSWEQPWSLQVTSRFCPCHRSSSCRGTGRRSRTVNATPRSAGWHGTAPRSAIFGRSILVTTCLPASLSLPPSKTPAAASSPYVQACFSHQTITEYLHGATLEEHRHSTCKRGKRTTTVYRWLTAVPLRATEDAIAINWFSIEDLQRQGKADPARQLRQQISRSQQTPWPNWPPAAGRAGRSRTRPSTSSRPADTTSSTASGTARKPSPMSSSPSTCWPSPSTAAYLVVLAWRAAVIALGPTYRFFEHPRTITTYVVFQHWDHLLQSIAAAAIRPPPSEPHPVPHANYSR